jgi:hypothetical protein
MGSTIFKGTKVATLKDTLSIGKDSTAPTIINSTVDPTSTATDAEPGSLLLNTSSGTVYKKLDSGSSTNWEIFGEGGSGGINYIENNDAETGSDGWARYDDQSGGDPSIPTDGTGTDVSITTFFGTISTAGVVRRGTQSFEFQKPASDTQGQGFSYDFSIDNQDEGKQLTVSFDYAFNNTDYVNGDIAVFVYQVSGGGALLGRVSNDDDGDVLYAGTSSPNGGRFTGSFQSVDGQADYRLIFHVTSTNLNDYRMYLDNVSVSPDVTVPGAIIGTETAFTPSYTGFTLGDGSETGWKYQRIGSSLRIQGETNFGSTSSISANIVINSPIPNITFDNSVVDLGIAKLYDSSGGLSETGMCRIGTTSIRLQGFGGRVAANSTTPFTWASGDAFGVDVLIPVVEWSAGASLSTTEAVFSTVKLNTTPGRIPTGTLNATYNKVSFTASDIENDTHNIFDDTSDQITIPRTGYYVWDAAFEITDSASTNRPWFNIRLLNTTTSNSLAQFSDRGDDTATAASSSFFPGGSAIFKANKGDVLEVQARTNATTPSYTAGLVGSHFSLYEQPDFSTFSVHGKAEYLQVRAATNTFADNANDPVGPPILASIEDAVGMTLTLTPGVWDIGFNVCTQFVFSAGVNDAMGKVWITDSSNVQQGDTNAFIFVNNLDITNWPARQLNHETRITVTETQTYKLRIECNVNGTPQDYQFGILGGVNFSGSMTNPDFDSVFWARRVS